MTNYYAVLDVKRTATPPEVKAAYRAKAREAHPDRGGSADRFAAVQRADESGPRCTRLHRQGPRERHTRGAARLLRREASAEGQRVVAQRQHVQRNRQHVK